MSATRKYPVLFNFALYSVALTLPLNIYFNSIAIIFLAFAWLLEKKFSIKVKLFFHHPLIAVFMLFYILFLIGMLYTSNIKEGSFNLEKKLSLLVVPLLLGTSITLNEKLKENTLHIFVVSSFIASLICLGNGLYRFFIHHENSALFYMELTSVLDSHAIYFAMYLCFSIFILLHLFNKHKHEYNIWQKRISLFLVFYFSGFIILLSSRIVLVFLLLYLTTWWLYKSYKKGKIALGLIVLVLITGASVLLFNRIDFLRERFYTLLESDISSPPDGENANGLTVRLVKWKCSMEGILEHPLLGTGTGDAQDYLVQCYEKRNFWGQYSAYRFNSHNQYLQTALTLGFSGLTCFFICLILPFIAAFRKKHYLLVSFIALISFCCLSESLLERQQGIVFFTFFLSLLAFTIHSPSPTQPDNC